MALQGHPICSASFQGVYAATGRRAGTQPHGLTFESTQMRSPIRTLKQLIHSIFKAFGYRLVRIDPSPGPSSALESFFSSLKQHGSAPRHIIDVGANRGNWTRTALKYFPDAHYTLVEPQDHLKSYIQDLLDRGCKIQWINAGAADKSGTMPMSISSRDDSSTFVLIDRHGHTTGSQRTTIEVKTLNEIASSSSAPPPDMVKIDAEGFDLNVLAGASDLLGKTDIFLVEAVICANYENSAAEVIKFMADAGYRLIDITDLNRSPKHGILWLCELAFLRNASQLLDAATSYE
jgi:FkbM family methyltransferase